MVDAMKFEKLENIAEVIAGQSPPSSTYNKDRNGIPFFQGKADYGKIYPVVRNWCTKPTKISLPNDILISVRAPVGPVNINNVEACIGRGLSAIRVKDNFSMQYVFSFLKANEIKIANLGVGSTFTAITQKDLKNLIIPTSDYQTQLHIANILTKAESLIAQRKESIRLLDEYLKSVFLEMFGDPVRNEKGWEIEKVISFADCIVPGRDKPKSFTGDIPWLTTEDLKHLSFSAKSNKNIALSQAEIEQVRARLIPSGSILMTCVGDLGVISINKTDCVVNQQLHTFQCKVGMNNIFLMFALSFQKGYMYKTASTTTVPYMNKTICNSIPVFQPPLELQTKFSQIVEKTEALKAQYQQSLQELENLYGSLSQMAFKGELSLKDESLLMAAEPETKYGE